MLSSKSILFSRLPFGLLRDLYLGGGEVGGEVDDEAWDEKLGEGVDSYS